MPAQHGEQRGGEAEGDEDEAHAPVGGGDEEGGAGPHVLLCVCFGGLYFAWRGRVDGCWICGRVDG